MRIRFVLIYLISLLISSCTTEKTNPADFVDPFIGTDFHGHTYPGVTLPQGSIQLSPDTRRGNWDACSGYHFSDNSIIGFSHTHLSGTGCIDLGDILFHPTQENIHLNDTGYIFNFMKFKHENEKAQPGFYRVVLDNGIDVQLTATRHVGIHKYVFPQSEESKIIIDLAHTLDNDDKVDTAFLKINGNYIEGFRMTSGWVKNQPVYFVAEFSQPPLRIELISDGKINPSDHVNGKNIQAIVYFNTNKEYVVESNVALSYTSLQGAYKNLKTETNGFCFEESRKKAYEIWNKELKKITIEGSDINKKIIFYTSLYHSLLTPTIMSDVDGAYPDHSGGVSRLNRNYYSTISLWDIFRSWGPLMTIINPTLINDMVNSMIDMYKHTGELPIWPLSSGETGTMIGYHSASIIADAMNKGISDFDCEQALNALVISSNVNRKGTSLYAENGFIPAESNRESVSCLLENAYDDWCIAQVALKIGDNSTAQKYFKRSLSYSNVFDGSTGFFRGKNSNGSWESPFSTYSAGRSFTEATPWQYRFFVPHDVNGMVNLLGSTDRFEAALDSLFIVNEAMDGHMADITGLIGQYAHGNEPSHHVAYLYNYIGKPWKTQEKVREIQELMYKATPDGIVGNEDCGQMSAWYVLSSIGLYQVCPGSNEFLFNTPLFKEANIALPNGLYFKITANDPDKNTYIKSVRLNGNIIERSYITFEEILKGGELEFLLDEKPNKSIDNNQYPYSYTQSKATSIPYIREDLNLFIDSVKFEIKTLSDDATIFYTLDGSEPSSLSNEYLGPITLNKSATISAIALKEGEEPSPTMQVEAINAKFKNPVHVDMLRKGIKYEYYEGCYSSVNDIKSADLKETGYINELSLSPAKSPDHFAFIFKAYLDISQDGIYEFYTISDDGSCLWIGDELVVNNDGSHSALRASGKVALKKGLHPLTIKYFEDYEGDECTWGWVNPYSNSISCLTKNQIFIRE